MTSDVFVNHSPTDNVYVPVTDNQCYGSVIVGQHHVTVSSNPCYETVTRGIDNSNTIHTQPEPLYINSTLL